LLLNLSSAGAGLVGAAAMLIFGSQAPAVLPHVLSFAAGAFLYVAMADLIPNLHRGGIDRNALRQTVLIALGVGTIVLMTQLR
jgi:zinc and cadmium transporter